MIIGHFHLKKFTVISLQRRCTESKEDALNLHESYIRDQILERLEPAAVNRSCVDGENINIVSDFLGTTHPQLLEIENNTRGQASCDKWYKERRIRLTLSNFGAVVKRRKTIHPKSLLQRMLENQSKQPFHRNDTLKKNQINVTALTILFLSSTIPCPCRMKKNINHTCPRAVWGWN